MHPRLKVAIDRWVGAGLLDEAAAARIRDFELREAPQQGMRWPAILALAFGGILLGAGVLLFVSAHWDELSPAGRFTLVLLMVALFHMGGALMAPRFAALATVLHAVGTTALGAGIFLSGQIFNLQEHWPGGVMLWAIGAAAGWWLLRDWTQAALLALLAPAWLIGEWEVAAEWMQGSWSLLCQGMTLLALTYLSARMPEREAPGRRALAWIGGLALLPVAIMTCLNDDWARSQPHLRSGLRIASWCVGILAPLALAWLLRGRAAWMNGVAAIWVVALAALARNVGHYNEPKQPGVELGLYAWAALGAIGLVMWGLHESRRERINLGVAGFALTVAFFYFSSVIDKLGRSASLISLGALFILGGWGLERARRRLIARLERSAS
ncbi:MAG TPA: DUF2157 domain-containing protein [Candidatus Polarisedimenticolia bacterium]|nr:DUF2157 domain-containing protein [Candidatus Polarisedimenticolia bacterium]